MSGRARLTFSLGAGILYGTAGRNYFRIRAASGGGMGRVDLRAAIVLSASVVRERLTSAGARLVVAGETIPMLPAGSPNLRLPNNPHAVSEQSRSGLLNVGLDPRGEGRGGPIPPGPYKISLDYTPTARRKHDYKRKAKLEQYHGVTVRIPVRDPMWGASWGYTHRSGFEIHAQGYFGSDGCIVPLKGTDFLELMDSLERERRSDHYAGQLEVYE